MIMVYVYGLQKDGKLYAIEPGIYYFSFEVEGYTYYYQKNIMVDYKLYDCSFAIEIKENNNKQLQCYIITNGKPTSRLKYDWYSTDTNILTISKYSTISIFNDGVVAIIATNKENKVESKETIIQENQEECISLIENSFLNCSNNFIFELLSLSLFFPYIPIVTWQESLLCNCSQLYISASVYGLCTRQCGM